MSIVWTASPRVKMMAWFWFSGFPSPSLGSPGSLIEYISYVPDENKECIRKDTRDKTVNVRVE